MRDALSADLLRAAFGNPRARLQNVADAQQTLLQAELGLFFGSQESVADTLTNAWYLHALAMRPSTDEDGVEQRRVSAGRVAGHVFDLHLQHGRREMTPETRLRYLLAAQSAYHVGGLAPNAKALVETPVEVTNEPGLTAMRAAHLLLGQRLSDLRTFLDASRQIYGNVAPESPLFAAGSVLEAIDRMHSYLVDGDEDDLAATHGLLEAAISNQFSGWDVDSRWTAALLLDFGDRLDATSIWNVVDPDSRTGRALVLGSPPIYTLWPPQLDFLTSSPSPVTSEWKRSVLSMPTSAGKTLVAQILTLTHLESRGDDVCIVAPTHALCREIRSDLDSRMAVFGGRTTGWSAEPTTARESVAVYTPEQLAALLRRNPEQLLDRFGLFIFDEAHLLADEQRGWNVEEVIATIHHLTRRSEHRIVVISAAMGHASHARQWFTLDEEPISRTVQWRGPRRLHAVYTANRRDVPEWTDVDVSPNSLPRRSTPVYGRIALQGPTTIEHREFVTPVGFEVQKQTRRGAWEKDGERSTKQILRVEPLLRHLLGDESSRVLAVVAQRREARELASVLAEGREAVESTEPLAERIETRMPGSELPGLVRRGIAYHHGLLPTDVQTDIEDATRRGDLRCIVSTTTLTEGVNLPFKAVVIVSDGFGPQANRTVLIDRPRMLNAFGRAGRASRETEGWLFYFASAQSYRNQLFDRFDTDPDGLDLISTITDEAAVTELAELEQLLANGTDVLLDFTGERLSGFISYIWYVAELLAALGRASNIDAIVAVLRDTLAWQQLDAGTRTRLEEVAQASHQEYLDTNPQRRARWARAGNSLRTSSLLEDLSAELANAIRSTPQLPASNDYLAWSKLVLTRARTAALVNLPENPPQLRGFKPRRNAPRSQLLDVELASLVRDWMAGVDPADLAADHLQEIDDENYRADSLSEFLSGVVEHHLPWALTTLTSWTNEQLGAALIPERLPWCIRFGVASDTAVELMDSGIRSRRLANVVAGAFGAVDSSAVLRQMLRQQTADQWRTDFNASPSEVSDLLEFVQDPSRQPVQDVLSGMAFQVEVAWTTGSNVEAGMTARIQADTSTDPSTLTVACDGELVGFVRPESHRDVQTLLGVGVRMGFIVIEDGGGLCVAVNRVID